jgi:hypothetical protein
MAASKPTSSLSEQRHILSTQRPLGTLAGGLGCCPLGDKSYHLPPECRGTGSSGIRSLIGFGGLVGPLSHSVLYLQKRTGPTLALKRFRREPAITGFD